MFGFVEAFKKNKRKLATSSQNHQTTKQPIIKITESAEPFNKSDNNIMNKVIHFNTFSNQDLPEHHRNFMSLKTVDCDFLEELSTTSSSDFDLADEDDDLMSLTDSVHLAVDRGIHLSPAAAKKRNRRQLTEDDSIVLPKNRVPLCIHENKNNLTNDVDFFDADGFESESEETSLSSESSGIKGATEVSEGQKRLERMFRMSSIVGSKTRRCSRKRQRTSDDCIMKVL